LTPWTQLWRRSPWFPLLYPQEPVPRRVCFLCQRMHWWWQQNRLNDDAQSIRVHYKMNLMSGRIWLEYWTTYALLAPRTWSILVEPLRNMNVGLVLSINLHPIGDASTHIAVTRYNDATSLAASTSHLKKFIFGYCLDSASKVGAMAWHGPHLRRGQWGFQYV
jgi:hypothetical protein